MPLESEPVLLHSSVILRFPPFGGILCRPPMVQFAQDAYYRNKYTNKTASRSVGFQRVPLAPKLCSIWSSVLPEKQMFGIVPHPCTRECLSIIPNTKNHKIWQSVLPAFVSRSAITAPQNGSPVPLKASSDVQRTALSSNVFQGSGPHTPWLSVLACGDSYGGLWHVSCVTSANTLHEIPCPCLLGLHNLKG